MQHRDNIFLNTKTQNLRSLLLFSSPWPCSDLLQFIFFSLKVKKKKKGFRLLLGVFGLSLSTLSFFGKKRKKKRKNQFSFFLLPFFEIMPGERCAICEKDRKPLRLIPKEYKGKRMLAEGHFTHQKICGGCSHFCTSWIKVKKWGGRPPLALMRGKVKKGQ